MNSHVLAAWTAAFFASASLFSHTVAARLLLLILGTAFAIGAIAKHRQSIRILPPIWWPFALWAAWAALSLTWSLDPQISDKELRNEIVYAAFALWVCYVAAQAPGAPRIMLSVLAAASAAVCAIALYYFRLGWGHYSTGYHGGAGNLSSALLTLMPCVLMAGWYAGRAGLPALAQASALALAVLLLAAAYTTLNRTVWLGFTGEILLIGALIGLRKDTPTSRGAKIAGAALAVAVVASGILMTLQIQSERAKVVANAPPLAKDSRLALWPEVIELIERRPYTGYGFGRGILRKPLKQETGNPVLWHAHNLFLDTLLQTGVPGLLLLLLLLSATAREGWRLARDQDDAAAACGIALIAVIAGMIVRNITDVLWVRQNALLYWGIVGILLGWGAKLRTRAA